MNGSSASTRASVILKPQRLIVRQSLIAVALGSSLVFVVLYSLAIPGGYWTTIAAIHAGVLACTAIAARHYFGSRIVLVEDGVEERGYAGRVSRVPRASAHSILIIQIDEYHSGETLTNLFVADAAGHRLLRMRGRYWSARNMEQVARHLGAVVTRANQSVSTHELHAEWPGLLYWFERVPPLDRITSRVRRRQHV
jgi:hypothetical protein